MADSAFLRDGCADSHDGWRFAQAYAGPVESLAFLGPQAAEHSEYDGGQQVECVVGLVCRGQQSLGLIDGQDGRLFDFGGTAGDLLAVDLWEFIKRAVDEVAALAAERPFWEKACLLHEETFRPADKPRKLRMARHYYDLWCLLKAGVGDRALANMPLFHRVAEHREVFFRYPWVDYSTHKPGTFRLIPPADQLPQWQADYNAMLGPMFFGEVPEFGEMIRVTEQFAERFNRAEV